MVRRVAISLVVVLTTWMGLGVGKGWSQPLPSAPAPVAPAPVPAPPPPSPGVAPAAPGTPLPSGPAPVTPAPAPYQAAPLVPPYPPPPCAPYQDGNGPLLGGNALLNQPFYPPPGWYAALEADFLVPHIKNRVTGEVNVANLFTNTVHLPTAELDWVAAPQVELGYRFAQGCGEVLLSYRLLASEGTAVIPNFDALGDGGLSSRLSLNVIDIDYGSREYSPASRWDLKWLVGVRVVDAFFDSQAEGFFMEQRTSNFFLGAGPHAGLEVWWHFERPQLALYGRVDGAVVVGSLHQSFEETFSDRMGPFIGGASRREGTQTVPTISAELGLGWAPPWNTWLRLSAGYRAEYWWDIGQLGNSRADLGAQGAFFRAEFSF